ncbi:HD domain-containing protein [Orbus sturtevantii]|uniref:HD domain-containing protein n=1 Tax=Orbus sturtevantii TaxID=3074109 RepID=UPI00370D76D3
MLTKHQQQIIANTYEYAKQKLSHDYSGHDIAHITRVVKLAQHIQKTEPESNLFIVTIAAYLHDVIDDKVIENVEKGRQELIEFMLQQQVESSAQQAILDIIDNMSFRKNLSTKQPLSKEGEIVQDADRLDAIGAIGIGRTFYYGANKKNVMYDPAIAPRVNMSLEDYKTPTTVINHFYEKLLLLKDQMNTAEGKKLALQRHQFLLNFLQQFEDEWNGSLA